MNLRHSLTAIGAVLSLGAGGFTFCDAMRERWSPPRIILSQAGRDQALIVMLQSARKSVYLRTESLALVPAGNELAQALQRKVTVSMELPMPASVARDPNCPGS